MDISDYKLWFTKYIADDFKYVKAPITDHPNLIDDQLKQWFILPTKKPQDLKISLWGDAEREENKKDSVDISEDEIVSLICEDE